MNKLPWIIFSGWLVIVFIIVRLTMMNIDMSFSNIRWQNIGNNLTLNLMDILGIGSSVSDSSQILMEHLKNANANSDIDLEETKPLPPITVEPVIQRTEKHVNKPKHHRMNVAEKPVSNELYDYTNRGVYSEIANYQKDVEFVKKQLPKENSVKTDKKKTNRSRSARRDGKGQIPNSSTGMDVKYSKGIKVLN